MSIVVARPYAKAVFELAQERGALVLWENFLDNLNLVLANALAKAWLLDPRHSKEEKVGFLVDLVSDGVFSEGACFLETLASFERLLVLPEIALLFKKFKKEALSEIDVDVVSAHSLTAAARTKLQKRLSLKLQKTVVLHDAVDPTLIGGIVIKAEGWVLDGSLKGRFDQLVSIVI